jgi:hypothetical protein
LISFFLALFFLNKKPGCGIVWEGKKMFERVGEIIVLQIRRSDALLVWLLREREKVMALIDD